MTHEEVAIAREIILAQVASDGGKGIEEIKKILPGSFPAFRDGYSAKDTHILKAISLIAKAHDSAFRFHVQYHDGDWSPIVYFSYPACGNRIQVSFHVPYCKEIYRWIKKGNKGFFSRWDHLNSREACIKLATLMKLS